MAQASSAQREPSMEEILASIRRIIEDSDMTHKQGNEPPAARKEPERAAPKVEPATGSVVDVDIFRAELGSAPQPQARASQVVPEVAPEKKPETFAEVQAQIAREPYPVSPEAAAPNAEDSELRALLDTEDELADDLDIDDELQAGDNFEDAEAAAAGAVPEHQQPAAAASEDHRELQPQTPKTAIISEHAGRQVAAAFGELSEAFAATRKKSFDELAEEMMRPMLQDWLDNNLPMLVERLVREEIERVARGVR
jgi:cell pole-organizing protein PopZ